MKKKIRWSTFTAIEKNDASNRIGITGGPEKNLEVSIVDKNSNKITQIKKVLGSEHTILITLKFQWEVTNYQDTDPDKIEYLIKKADDCWEVEKEYITVKPGKKDKFEKAKKEMYKNLLKEEFDDKIDIRKEMEGTDIEYRILPDDKGNYKVLLYETGKNDSRQFLWEKIEIKPKYWQNKEVDSDNTLVVKFQEEDKKFRWTKGWIIFFVILFVIIILGIIFWKKIWRWIKGEREQEKKVREQIDIF